MNQISKRLVQLMKSAQAKQLESAKKSGIAQSTIHRIIHGQNAPNIKTLQRLAKGFNVPVEYFTHPNDIIATIILEVSSLPDPALADLLGYIRYKKNPR